MKNQLKKFFHKVHPDRFHNHPEMQKINQKSFQELMGFLDITQKESKHFLFPQVFKLHFYYQSGDKFEEIRMTFNIEGELRYNASARRQYADQCIVWLLQACGIEIGTKDSTSFNYDVLREDILKWLRGNLSKSRQIQEEYQSISNQVESLKTRLIQQLKLENLTISMFISLPEALQSLEKLNSHSLQLQNFNTEGIKIRIGRKYEIDDDGMLIIPHNFDIDACTRFIAENFDKIPDRIARTENFKQKIRQLRRELEDIFGCDSIGQSFSCTDEEYYRCLCQFKRYHRQIRAFDLHHIIFMIERKFDISDTGMYYLPFDFAISVLQDNFQKNLETARQMRVKYIKMKQEADELVEQLKNQLELNRIGWSTGISMQEYLNCLNRMLEAVSLLEDLPLKGANFFVSNRFRLWEDGTIQIKHNFDLDTIKGLLQPIELKKIKG